MKELKHTLSHEEKVPQCIKTVKENENSLKERGTTTIRSNKKVCGEFLSGHSHPESQAQKQHASDPLVKHPASINTPINAGFSLTIK